MLTHDYKNYPELSNSQLEELQFSSPHKQITEDFIAEVIKVHDGDTVTLRVDFRDFYFPLRFLSIDAPELSEGGEQAGDWLRSRIEGRIVKVRIDPLQRVGKYGRLLGRVVCDGLDVADEMLNAGLVSVFGEKNEGLPEPLNKIFCLRAWFG